MTYAANISGYKKYLADNGISYSVDVKENGTLCVMSYGRFLKCDWRTEENILISKYQKAVDLRDNHIAEAVRYFKQNGKRDSYYKAMIELSKQATNRIYKIIDEINRM